MSFMSLTSLFSDAATVILIGTEMIRLRKHKGSLKVVRMDLS